MTEDWRPGNFVESLGKGLIAYLDVDWVQRALEQP